MTYRTTRWVGMIAISWSVSVLGGNGGPATAVDADGGSGNDGGEEDDVKERRCPRLLPGLAVVSVFCSDLLLGLGSVEVVGVGVASSSDVGAAVEVSRGDEDGALLRRHENPLRDIWLNDLVNEGGDDAGDDVARWPSSLATPTRVVPDDDDDEDEDEDSWGLCVRTGLIFNELGRPRRDELPPPNILCRLPERVGGAGVAEDDPDNDKEAEEDGDTSSEEAITPPTTVHQSTRIASSCWEHVTNAADTPQIDASPSRYVQKVRDTAMRRGRWSKNTPTVGFRAW